MGKCLQMRGRAGRPAFVCIARWPDVVAPVRQRAARQSSGWICVCSEAAARLDWDEGSQGSPARIYGGDGIVRTARRERVDGAREGVKEE